MVTVIDPSGAPTIQYNRSGTSIVELTAGVDSQNAAQIPNVVSGCTIVLVNKNTNGTSIQYVRLPGNCEIGDAVEVHWNSFDVDYGAVAIMPSGDSTTHGQGLPTIGRGGFGGAIFRKVASAKWVFVGQKTV